MPAGRPTVQTPELIAQAWDYIENFIDHGDKIPSIVGMSKVLMVDRTTLYDWAGQDDNEFSHILSRCKAEQERHLLNNGLDGTFNSAITKLVLGKHDYHDKQDTTHAGGVNLNVTPADENL